jgi:hypothetical protein
MDFYCLLGILSGKVICSHSNYPHDKSGLPIGKPLFFFHIFCMIRTQGALQRAHSKVGFAEGEPLTVKNVLKFIYY